MGNLPIVCGRGGGIGLHETGTAQSNGTDTTATYRIAVPIVATAGSISGLQVEIAHMIGEGVPANPVTRELSLIVQGVLCPVTWQGAFTKTLKPGDARILSDIIAIPTSKPGDVISVIDNVSVTAGGVWALGNPPVVQAGDGVVSGANAVRTNAGMNSADAYGLSPVCIRGVSSKNMPGGGVIIGDSIAAGNGDSGHEFGFAVRAFNAAGVGFVRIALPGETVSGYLASHLHRGALLSAAPYHLLAYGTNDINTGRTAAQIKADFKAAWALSRQCGAEIVDQCTIPPGEFSGAAEAARTEVNTWLRSGAAIAESAAQLSKITDRAALVESNTDGGAVAIGGAFWAAGFKSNTLHPSEAGHTAMAAALVPDALMQLTVSSVGVLSTSQPFYNYNNIQRIGG